MGTGGRLAVEAHEQVEPDVERRSCPDCELRAVDGDTPTLVGYAALFNSLSEEMWGAREKIAPGAFRNVLTTSPDVRALVDHETGLMTIGRTTNGTLTLSEDSRGLLATIQPADTQAGRDVVELVKRGDLNQMSFAFRVAKGGDEWEEPEDKNRMPVRTIVEVGGLYDVSVVTYPAYPETTVDARTVDNDVALRSLAEWRAERAKSAQQAICRTREKDRLKLLDAEG